AYVKLTSSGTRFGKRLIPRRAGHLVGRVLDRLHDVLVASAAAEVALQPVANLLFGRIRVALEQVGRGHDHAGRAVAALQAVLLPEAFLDRVQLAVLGHALDRRDLSTISLDRQDGARLDRLAVQMDRAGAALAGVAANVRAGKPKVLAQEMNEQRPGLDIAR